MFSITTQHWFDFNETCYDTLVPSLVEHIIGMSRLSYFQRSYGPLFFQISLHLGCLGMFSETAGLISMKLAKIHWLMVPSLVEDIIGMFRPFIFSNFTTFGLSALLLRNHCLDFNEICYDTLIPSLVIISSILGMFWFSDFQQSYGP
jgi:hypothetical protein